MKFCPECKSRLVKREGMLACSRCEYTENQAAPSTAQGESDATSELNVLAESDGNAMLPTIKINCPKCDHTEAVWWMLQTRSADEPTTQFYRCTKCEHTWRNYS